VGGDGAHLRRGRDAAGEGVITGIAPIVTTSQS
jgi:hypothetical protein